MSDTMAIGGIEIIVSETIKPELAVMAPPDLLARATKAIGAQPTDIPGLWSAPGFPELTTNQLLSEAFKADRSLTRLCGAIRI